MSAFPLPWGRSPLDLPAQFVCSVERDVRHVGYPGSGERRRGVGLTSSADPQGIVPLFGVITLGMFFRVWRF
jgi:hypothetical protein